jgi:hypothetical protein
VIDLEPAFAAAHFEFGKLLFQKNSLPTLSLNSAKRKARSETGSARYQLGLALTRAGQRRREPRSWSRHARQSRRTQAGSGVAVDG